MKRILPRLARNLAASVVRRSEEARRAIARSVPTGASHDRFVSLVTTALVLVASAGTFEVTQIVGA